MSAFESIGNFNGYIISASDAGNLSPVAVPVISSGKGETKFFNMQECMPLPAVGVSLFVWWQWCGVQRAIFHLTLSAFISCFVSLSNGRTYEPGFAGFSKL